MDSTQIIIKEIQKIDGKVNFYIAILGSVGSGKSTLMRLLAELCPLIKPVDGDSVDHLGKKNTLRLRSERNDVIVAM